MTGPTEFMIERRFDAAVDEIWAAWTQPDRAAQWWHPGGVHTPRDTVEIDLRPGGRYAYTMIDDQTGEEFPAGGAYLEVDPPHRLVFTWGDLDNDPDRAAIATVEIEPDGDGAVMRFTLTRVRDDFSDVHSGWSEAFDFLAELL